jgi:hypothetical protein
MGGEKTRCRHAPRDAKDAACIAEMLVYRVGREVELLADLLDREIGIDTAKALLLTLGQFIDPVNSHVNAIGPDALSALS